MYVNLTRAAQSSRRSICSWAPICGVTLHQVRSIWCSNVVFRKYGAPQWRNRASRPAPPIRERPPIIWPAEIQVRNADEAIG
jgi:hypothetical protein